MNLLPYIPYYDYRTKWINTALNNAKTVNNNVELKDYWNEDMSWDVIEYYLHLAYDKIFFDRCWGPGLRIVPTDLKSYYKNI